MILRRLADALREQNWFTVVLEVLIVVVGIFIGLQVDDWAKERGDRVQEHAALERLFVESNNSFGLISEYLERTKRVNELRRNAVAFIDSDAPLPENSLPVKIGVNTIAQFPPLLPASAAYDELRSAGQLQLIQSSELRGQISAFYTNLDHYNRLQSQFGNGTEQFWTFYRRNIRWRYNPASESSDILLSTYDWDKLRGDDDFKFSLIGLLRNQLVSEQALIGLQINAKVVCDAIGRAIARPCESEEIAGR